MTLDELLQTLQRRGIPLPYEMGTFIALQVCERIVRSPVAVQPAGVWLSEEGEVGVAAGPSVGEAQAAAALLRMLGDLLVRSAHAVPPMLMELVEQGEARAVHGLGVLRDDLEAALVPLNRGATTRVLVRLLREAHRADGGRAAPGLAGSDEARMTGELDRLLGVVGETVGSGAVEPVDDHGDLDALIYATPAPIEGPASGEQTLRLHEDYGRIRERSRSLALGLYASATGLAATMVLLWYVTR